MDLFAYYEKKDKIDAANLVNKKANATNEYNHQIRVIRKMIELVIKNIHETESPPDEYRRIRVDNLEYIGWFIGSDGDSDNLTVVWLLNSGKLVFHNNLRNRDDVFLELKLSEVADLEQYQKTTYQNGKTQISQMQKDGYDDRRITPNNIIQWFIKKAPYLKIAGNPEWEALVSTIN